MEVAASGLGQVLLRVPVQGSHWRFGFGLGRVVSEIDDIQYGIGQGPCITAAREGQTVMSGSLGSDPRWRKFGSTVARLGVHSVLSLPLVHPRPGGRGDERVRPWQACLR